MIVAVDGPAGSGKGTVTKRIEKELGFLNLDTGATYRCVALQVVRKKLNLEDTDEIVKIANEIDIKIDNSGDKDIILLNGEDVSKEIRTKEVTAVVSQISSIIPVRERMVEVQRQLAVGKNVIVEGRDIGTVVFPNADVKIYLDASEEIRAKRRYEENIQNGMNTTYEEILENVRMRDYNDMHKEVGALKVADDAIVVDSSNLTIDEVVEKIKEIIFENREEKTMKTKENKGITLVSLVITIILLLILAGITIASITSTGLFEKTKEAREESEKASIIENIKLEIMAKQSENQGNIKANEVGEILSKYGNISSDNNTLVIKNKKYEIPISSIISLNDILKQRKNLFNKNSKNIIVGKILNEDGSSYTENQYYNVSDYIYMTQQNMNHTLQIYKIINL